MKYRFLLKLIAIQTVFVFVLFFVGQGQVFGRGGGGRFGGFSREGAARSGAFSSGRESFSGALAGENSQFERGGRQAVNYFEFGGVWYRPFYSGSDVAYQTIPNPTG